MYQIDTANETKQKKMKSSHLEYDWFLLEKKKIQTRTVLVVCDTSKQTGQL